MVAMNTYACLQRRILIPLIGLSTLVSCWVGASGQTELKETELDEFEITLTAESGIRIGSSNGATFESVRNSVYGNESVVLYSAAWCVVCKRAKQYFDHNEVRYLELDIEQDEQGIADFKRMNGRSVPIILVGNKRMNGFDETRFEKLYSSLWLTSR